MFLELKAPKLHDRMICAIALLAIALQDSAKRML